MFALPKGRVTDPPYELRVLLMPETDLILMSLCIFLPSAVALALLFIPKHMTEYVRWFTLSGTATTFVISTVIFVNYLGMLHSQPEEGGSRPSKSTTLLERSQAQEAREIKGEAPLANDQLGRVPWISRFNIDYFLGVDGISMAMILLTTALFFLSMIASWGIEKHVKGYCALFLLLETGVIGSFVALDFFLFYIFWEVMLFPMYFLIGVWGGPRREYAAIKFFLYTLFGSVFILIALLAFYFTDVRDFVPAEMYTQRLKAEIFSKNKGIEEAKGRTAFNTFDLMVLTRAGKAALDVQSGRTDAVVRSIKADHPDYKEEDIRARLEQPFFKSQAFQITMFLFLFVGFAIKVPLFPFHTWLPDAHVEAPTPISMILAGILLKLGGYGIIRICYPICPWAAEYLAYYIGFVAMINIVYGAFAAMAQTDFKKLVAYSSVSHMGYVILGIALWSASGSNYWAWGLNGAMYQMIAHGISSAGMFFCVGVIYDRAHHRNLDNFRGLFEPMPLYCGISAIIFFAGLGLPGLCGFVGEFMVILSTWNFAPAAHPESGKVFALLAALTVVITAGYILWTLQRVYLGTNAAYKDYKDITPRELLVAIPLVVLAVAFGIFPQQLLLNWMEPHVTGIIDVLMASR
jgi:NADH-quinone oxidoreductase subunit M